MLSIKYNYSLILSLIFVAIIIFTPFYGREDFWTENEDFGIFFLRFLPEHSWFSFNLLVLKRDLAFLIFQITSWLKGNYIAYTFFYIIYFYILSKLLDNFVKKNNLTQQFHFLIFLPSIFSVFFLSGHGPMGLAIGLAIILFYDLNIGKFSDFSKKIEILKNSFLIFLVAIYYEPFVFIFLSIIFLKINNYNFKFGIRYLLVHFIIFCLAGLIYFIYINTLHVFISNFFFNYNDILTFSKSNSQYYEYLKNLNIKNLSFENFKLNFLNSINILINFKFSSIFFIVNIFLSFFLIYKKKINYMNLLWFFILIFIICTAYSLIGFVAPIFRAYIAQQLLLIFFITIVFEKIFKDKKFLVLSLILIIFNSSHIFYTIRNYQFEYNFIEKKLIEFNLSNKQHIHFILKKDRFTSYYNKKVYVDDFHANINQHQDIQKLVVLKVFRNNQKKLNKKFFFNCNKIEECEQTRLQIKNLIFFKKKPKNSSINTAKNYIIKDFNKDYFNKNIVTVSSSLYGKIDKNELKNFYIIDLNEIKKN